MSRRDVLLPPCEDSSSYMGDCCREEVAGGGMITLAYAWLLQPGIIYSIMGDDNSVHKK
jgi:hypothetical protein